MIAWIWLVTAYDIRCCEYLDPRYELNPLAYLVLIHYGVWTLVGVKVFGTFLATEILRHLDVFYSAVIALGMTALLIFLFH